MKIRLTLNGKKIEAEIKADTLLLDLVREKGCYSVKRGCRNFKLRTLHGMAWMGKPVLSLSVLAARADGQRLRLWRAFQKESEEFADFLAREGADQCGFCSPGLIMNVLAMERELVKPTMEEVREYLAGNLCRCTGYAGQLRALEKYLNRKKEA